MRIEIVDDVEGSSTRLRSALLRVLRSAADRLDLGDADVAIRFVGPEEMTELNGRYRDKPDATDVLSFPSGVIDLSSGRTQIGDIAICPAIAERQAAECGHSREQEILVLALHGFLHLLGYDHETDDGEMETLEIQLRSALIRERPEHDVG